MTSTHPVAVTSCGLRSFLGIGFALLGIAVFAAPTKFDIPAQPAPEGLKLFTQQSGQQAIFVEDELRDVRANEVKGEMEPVDALARLLHATGFEARQKADGILVIGRNQADKPGSIEGTVTEDKSGRPVTGARVSLTGTTKSVLTDKRGRFSLDGVAPGGHSLMVMAEGMQDTKVTDVAVKPGHRLSLSAIGIPVQQEGTLKLDPYVVSAKKNDGVVELDPFSVEGQREKPFTTANVDIPRTRNDIQPYTIFDSKDIETSGATSIEDFLKKRLTMNATALSAGQGDVGLPLGNRSAINLRGLGTDKTLVLVNGRRIPGITIQTTSYQPDINGIPLNAIDRIEILASSASGIYGGSAIGGVVNVILKKNYEGGEVRAVYDTPSGADAPTRTLSASSGLTLENGKTHLMLNASWSDARAMHVQDRRELLQDNLDSIAKNDPTFSLLGSAPFLGSLPNIRPQSTQVTTLTLKNGGAIGSRMTHIDPGISTATSAEQLSAALAANAGSFNLDLPPTGQSPFGLLRAFGVAPESSYFQFGLSRQMAPKLTVFLDASHRNTRTQTFYNPINTLLVPVTSPVNPFTTSVFISVPNDSRISTTTHSTSIGSTLGAIWRPTEDWTVEVDYTFSKTRFKIIGGSLDTAARTADLRSGVLNPFVDTLLFPLNLDKYFASYSFESPSRLHDFAVRSAGQLFALPWGTPNFALGLEHRIADTDDFTQVQTYPLAPANNGRFTYFGGKQTTDSLYMEFSVPVLQKDMLPFMHSLDLQMAARGEKYTVDTGTQAYFEYPNDPSSNGFSGPTVNGGRVISTAAYQSRNGTIGLKYEPLESLAFRVSLATAFLPPSPDQLTPNLIPDSFDSTVFDPKTEASSSVQTFSGGNPDLVPQDSESFNAGVIWQPKLGFLAGLRINAEYYRINQNNYITYLPAQVIVDLEAIYPDRVVRNAAGQITQVRTSLLNLYRRETEGWDFSIEYPFETNLGTFQLRLAESVILHIRDQYSLTLPSYDSVGFPSEGGAGKYKTNASVQWEKAGWTAGWSANHFSSYKQYGAAGGPTSQMYYDGLDVPNGSLIAQGTDTIPSQIYHDLFLGYSFASRHAQEPGTRSAGKSWLSGLQLQFGVRNIFAKAPPFDANYDVTLYTSPYGDVALRSFWVSIKKAF